MKKLIALATTASVSLSAQGATLNLNAVTDTDTDAEMNTSSTTAYLVGGNATAHDGGYTSGVTADTETFYFLDAATGIKFNYDITLTAIGGDIQGTTLILGVTDNDIDVAQGYKIEVSNMAVDISGYIPGSFNGFAAVMLNTAAGGGDGFGYGLKNIGFADFTAEADPLDGTETVLSITDGTTPLTHSDTNNNFNYGTDGYPSPNINADGGFFQFTMTQPAGTNDDDVDLTYTTVRLQIDLLEAIPEPSSVTLVALSGLALFSRRRRV